MCVFRVGIELIEHLIFFSHQFHVSPLEDVLLVGEDDIESGLLLDFVQLGVEGRLIRRFYKIGCALHLQFLLYVCSSLVSMSKKHGM